MAKKPILACGADMKGAFAIAKGKEAFLFDAFGDLGDPDNLAKYEKSVREQIKKLGIKPAVIACDLHPEYFSSKFAESFQFGCSRAHLSVPYNCQLYRVQHHEAHVAAGIVDNNIKGSVIGVAFDGTGYGSDGNIWGGEFFIGNPDKFIRVAHLEYIPMPGGECAIKEPWRMALSYLYHACEDKKITSRLVQNYISSESEKHNFGLARRIKILLDQKLNSPLTSSAGRLFDAAGSLILAKGRVSREAELPIELERSISGKECGSYKFKFQTGREGLIIDTTGIIKGIIKDLAGKTRKPEISRKFHNAIADIVAETVLRLSKKFGIKKTVLSGGVFQNRYLTAKAVRLLTAKGIKVYTHSNIAANDSGIPLGQIAIASMRG